MKFNFVVHSVSEEEIVTKGEVNGKTVDVKVPGLTVELVSENGSMSHTYRIHENIEEALELYQRGETVVVTHEE